MGTAKAGNKREQILRKEWEDDMRSRSVARLLTMLRYSEKYTPECLAFVKEVIIEKLVIGTDPLNRKIEKKSTREVFLATLKKMGCRYDIDKEDGMVCFMYQGVYFYAQVNDTIPFINIYDYNWDVVDMKDIDEVSRARRSVNTANIKSLVTTYCYVNKEQNTLHVSCKSQFPFSAHIEDREEYLNMMLNRFFRAHRSYELHLEKLWEEEGEQE